MCVEALVVQKSRSIDLTFNNLTSAAPLVYQIDILCVTLSKTGHFPSCYIDVH